jgi:dUTP pyrophosphatase
MKVKIKKLDERAVVPSYSKKGDAGMDLTAINISRDNVGNITYHTGLAIEIPEGYVGLLFPRSSISKKQQFLTNSVGVIDSGYRGEIMAKFKPVMGSYESILDLFESNEYQVGDRIVQMIILPYPQIEFEEVEELSSSERGHGGFGSTNI